MSVAAVILAAGEGKRMRCPKALLAITGTTFADHAAALYSAVCDPVIIVLGAKAREAAATIRRSPKIRIAENPDYLLGQTSSLQCGLRQVPRGARGVLFSPVDLPEVQESTLYLLARSAGERILIPTFEGRKGHPTYVPVALIEEFLALPPDGDARDVIRRHPADLIETADRGTVDDIDDPDAYEQLMCRTAHCG